MFIASLCIDEILNIYALSGVHILSNPPLFKITQNFYIV